MIHVPAMILRVRDLLLTVKALRGCTMAWYLGKRMAYLFFRLISQSTTSMCVYIFIHDRMNQLCCYNVFDCAPTVNEILLYVHIATATVIENKYSSYARGKPTSFLPYSATATRNHCLVSSFGIASA